MAKIKDVEQAMIDRLKQEVPYLKTVGTLPDRLKMDADDRALLTPAAYVIYEGAGFDAPCMNTLMQDKSMSFSVEVVVRNFTSAKKLLQGEGQVVGVYDALDDVRECFTGQTLGLDITPMFPVSEGAVDGDITTAVYGIEFTTKTRV